MFDIKWIRDNPEEFDRGLARRGLKALAASLIELDEKRRAHVGKVQDAQQRRNAASKEIGQAMGQGKSDIAEKLKAEVAELKTFLGDAEAVERTLDAEIRNALSVIPNLPLESVPDGEDESGTTEIDVSTPCCHVSGRRRDQRSASISSARRRLWLV